MAGPPSQSSQISHMAAALTGVLSLLRSAAIASISQGIRRRHCGIIEPLPAVHARVVDGGPAALVLDRERPDWVEAAAMPAASVVAKFRSEEHTSELQSLRKLV